jgi:hypothetical protein
MSCSMMKKIAEDKSRIREETSEDEVWKKEERGREERCTYGSYMSLRSRLCYRNKCRPTTSRHPVMHVAATSHRVITWGYNLCSIVMVGLLAVAGAEPAPSVLASKLV